MKCRACGAESSGFVCLHCGTSLAPTTSASDEARATEELHQAVVHAKTDEERARILANGPIPDHTAEIVDAALRSAALLDPKKYATEVPTAAIARIESMRAKLRLLGEDAADREIENRIKRYHVEAGIESREGSQAVLLMLGVVVVLVGLVIVAYRACR